jgi:phosphoribosylformylglycinamidine synthase
MSPRVLILRAPGTNCDLETAFAFEQAGAVTERVHINRLLEFPEALDAYQILCIPGGFSYGDDLAAGRILASQVRHHLGDAFRRYADGDHLVLGICNGFQVLIQTGLLLPGDGPTPLATLTDNDSARFEDRWAPLKVVGDKSVFLKGIEQMYLPVAHAEGKFVARDAETLASLEASGQLVLRYRRQDGEPGPAEYPDNPNGSQADVAGLCDATGRVLGLMPHPERYIDPTQHPHWTRLPTHEGDGLQLFRNAVAYFG